MEDKLKLAKKAVPDGLLDLRWDNYAAEDRREEVDIVLLSLCVAEGLLEALQQLLEVLKGFEVLLVNGLLLQNRGHILVVVPKISNNLIPIWKLVFRQYSFMSSLKLYTQFTHSYEEHNFTLSIGWPAKFLMTT